MSSQSLTLDSDPGVISEAKAASDRNSLSWDFKPEDISIEALREETERKREAFMQLLAQRYPQYADKIQGKPPTPQPQGQTQAEKPARSRDGQRRRTAVVTYDPTQAGNTLEYDDVGTMSDLELPSFQRGGFMRTSLPIVRSGSTSLERPLGLVFLVYGDQTKKSLLPNEITTLDTVRALFVRAFPDLTLDQLESPRKKIYLLDPATNIYFQLEDLAEIKDRSVLKIHETDSDEPQKVKERQEVRGRTVQMPRPHGRHGYAEVPVGQPEMFSTKAQSLPPQGYPELMHDMERRSRSRTPEPAERPRSLSAGAQGRQRFSHSPDRMPTPERGLNPIPENRQLPPGYREDPNGYYENTGAYRGMPYPATYEGGLPHSTYAAPQQAPPGTQAYVARSTRAPPLAHAQRAIAPSPDLRDAANRAGNRHSLAFAPISAGGPSGTPEGGFQRTQSYRVPPTEREGVELTRSHSMAPQDAGTRNRIEKMEAQLANLTAWVHYQKADSLRRDVTPPPRSLGSTASESSDTFPASSASSLSDIPDGGHYPHHPRSSGESTPINISAEVAMSKLGQLKKDLSILRRQQQLNMEAMKDEFMEAFSKIKKVLSALPSAEYQVNIHQRTEATTVKNAYIDDKTQVDKELGELEASVDELKNDVISRQCRVNMADIEGMALILSNVTKTLGDLKARFPQIHTQMKTVMDSELRVVVAEEKFLKDQPNDIEASLKRCKNLSSTLFTMKRLASVQDHRAPQIPNLPSSGTDDGQKEAVLENIRALVPDHDHRVQQMEAADAARERKKKISTQQEALKFGKSLEIASRNLKPAGEKGEEEKEPAPTAHVKPAVPAKPTNIITSSTSSSSTSSFTPAPGALSQPPTAPPVSTVTISAVPSSKSSFSAALSAKPVDKPTATVSAMTSVNTATSSTVPSTAGSGVKAAASLPLTDTTGRLSSVYSGTGPVTQTVNTDTTKSEPAVVASVNPISAAPAPMYHTVSPTTSVKPPVFSKPNTLGFAPPSKPVPSDPVTSSVKGPQVSEKPKPDPDLPKKDSTSGKSETTKSVTWSATTTEIKPVSESAEREVEREKEKGAERDTEMAVVERGGSLSPVNGIRENSPSELAAQKQAARSAFFSSLSTPPTSPSMPSSHRNSAMLDDGPVLRPSSTVASMEAGPTINLVLSGIVSPKSPTSPGSFTISPPKEVVVLAAAPLPSSSAPSTTLASAPTPAPASRSLPTSTTSSPTRSSIPQMVSVESKPPPLPPPLSPPASVHSSDSENEVTMRRKVPPPPPPRKGSRPTSANMSPVNGGSPAHQAHDTPPPRFVGGPLGQHRLSGGPLSSTPKPPSQQALSKFERDIASGLYANLNRPELQTQKSTPQQILSQAQNLSPAHKEAAKVRHSAPVPSSAVPPPGDDAGIPPPPSVTMAIDREERGSSSESTSSSSGTSMGSQQSVVSVVRSASVSGQQAPPPPSTKPKPEPPRRHSSLLAKFTGSRDSKHKINNGKANMNGVDL